MTAMQQLQERDALRTQSQATRGATVRFGPRLATAIGKANTLYRSSLSVLYGDRVWTKSLATCARK
jgi:hypothetical protein